MSEAQLIPPTRSVFVPEPGEIWISAYTTSRRLSPWLPILTSFAAAELAAYLFCRLPKPHAHLPALVLAAVFYVGLTLAAGAIGMRVPRILTGKKCRPTPAILAGLVSTGWLFFPSIALLYRQGSRWIILATAAASFPIALSLNQLFRLTPSPAPPIPWNPASSDGTLPLQTSMACRGLSSTPPWSS